jgi:hypothetical protein
MKREPKTKEAISKSVVKQLRYQKRKEARRKD